MLPQEILSYIGKPGSTRTLIVEKGAIERYADAVGDPNPLYWDETYAKKTKYGSIIAPPGFLGWPARNSGEKPEPPMFTVVGAALELVGLGRIVNGSMEFEFLVPIHAGDTLTASSMVKDIVEREGKTGKMALVTIETTYINQKGETVAKQRHTTIHR